MMAAQCTIVCVHEEDRAHIGSNTQIRDQRVKRRRRTTQSGGRSWKRRCCRERRFRGWRGGTTLTRTRCSMFHCRKAYREGQLGGAATSLLPVKVAKELAAEGQRSVYFTGFR